MISFKISTPGKVILFGEHSVVYNKTAVAASLDQHTSLDFHQLPEDESSICVEMRKVGLSLRIPVDQTRDRFFGANAPKKDESDYDATLAYIREFVDDTLKCDTAQHKSGVECLLYAMLQVSQMEKAWKLVPFRLELNTELSIGSGQGSSASFSVSLVTCFLHFARLQRDPRSPYDLNHQDREIVSNLAFNCEKIMHGAPSGIDNTVCTFGSVVEFRKGSPPKFIPVVESRKIKILIVDTKVGRSTKTLVERLCGLKTTYPRVFEPVLQAMDEVAKRVIHLLREMQTVTVGDDDRYCSAFNELAVLIDINQGLLVTCQVSHPSLDTICANAKRYGFSAKLTGAGGGGFAYVLIPPDAPEEKVRDLSFELTCRGFTVSETNLGGSGVQIHKTSEDS
ncbi:mevalonate kinase [Copidosoma floridanum]|uniref:mevalonate kinase n=1 Tax=Copidosoma floridanum TaxID=29053 RepID=UPI0006C9A04E|nr:mevalonate kinase [Copidosoma floridanum]